jgi:ribonuclease VapC
MVLDTSAIVAILLGEPPADRLVAAVEADRTRLVSAATVVEASLVLLGRYGEAGEPELDRLLRAFGAEVVPVGEEQANLARHAALRYGRGRHAAGLNFGDCFSYALAVARDEPLLFVGDDFAQTDVRVVGW